MRTSIKSRGGILDIRGSLGKGGGFGRVTFGYNYIGYYSWYSGIYQKKYYYGKPYISKMKFYRSTNPQTPAQQAWRAVFATAKGQWDLLSPETKEIYRLKGAIKKMTGMNIFISEYLKSHRL